MKKIFIIIITILLSLNLFSCVKKEEEKEEETIEISLKDKITQLIVPSFRYLEYEKINNKVEAKNLEEMNDELKEFLEEYKFGGIILFNQNLISSKQAYKLINDLKKANSLNCDIPLLIGLDQEGGSIKRLSFGTSMPGNMALTARGDAKNAYLSSNIIGEELALLGFNLTFAPVVDINSNPNNPIIGIRSFGDDPDYCKDYIKESINGFHDSNIAVAIKHFPGHGDTRADSHTGLPLLNKSLDDIKNFELKAFKTGIENNTDIIMSAHIQFPNIDDTTYKNKDGKEIYLPATLSKKIINILRNDLNYDGVIISDSFVMDAIKENFEKKDSAKLALEAGIDMILMPISYEQSLTSYIKELKEYIDMLIKMVEDKEIDEKIIDDAYNRVLKLKETRGLSDKENKETNYTALIGSKKNHEIELEITKKAITLVENKNNTLPLNKDNKTIILTPFSSQINSLYFAENILLEKGLINDETIREYCYGDDNLESFKNYLDNEINNYDSLVIISSMYSNDDLNLDYALIIDYALELAQRKGIKNILISSQLPYDLARFNADSKIACYYAGGMSEIPNNFDEDVSSYAPNLIATYLLIFGEDKFSGKLPINIPDIKIENNQYILDIDNIKYERGH